MTQTGGLSAHVDPFARDRLPPPAQWPESLFELSELQSPQRLNCATELLDRWVQQGQGGRLCVRGRAVRRSHAELQARANRIARVLVEDMGLLPGNRVLLRGANSPLRAACWFAVVKAGGRVQRGGPARRSPRHDRQDACGMLRPGFEPGAGMAAARQDFVKQTIAPYQYPRGIEFHTSLPRTETGKLQRFKLRRGGA